MLYYYLFPFYASLCFFSTISQRPIFYFLLHYISQTVLVASYLLLLQLFLHFLYSENHVFFTFQTEELNVILWVEKILLLLKLSKLIRGKLHHHKDENRAVFLTPR